MNAHLLHPALCSSVAGVLAGLASLDGFWLTAPPLSTLLMGLSPGPMPIHVPAPSSRLPLQPCPVELCPFATQACACVAGRSWSFFPGLGRVVWPRLLAWAPLLAQRGSVIRAGTAGTYIFHVCTQIVLF